MGVDERDEISRRHFEQERATNFETYTSGVELDEHGRPPVGTEVVVSPFYALISDLPAGTRGLVTWLFFNHTTPQFKVTWGDPQSPVEGSWYVVADLLRFDLFAKFTGDGGQSAESQAATA